MSPAAQVEPAGLVAAAAEGDRRALARLLTAIERGGAPAREAAAAVHGRGAPPATVGITGAPGAGKSTLTDALASVARERNERVAIVAIDPSSPFSGGAILGDRVRLRNALAADDGVYVRSLASRGQLGGLARAVPEIVRALGAAGWPTVVLETVGVGQSEVAVAAETDTTIVVVTPGWGDEVQANKAGLLEVADVLVVNKADRDGARATAKELERMLDLSPPRSWRSPVLLTVAIEGTGAEEVWSAVTAHRAHLDSVGDLRRRRAQRVAAEVRARVADAVAARVEATELSDDGQAVMAAALSGELAPATAVDRLTELALGESS